MSGSVNKVILVGNLGRDPEKRDFQSGGSCVTIRLATSETWKDRNSGERKERTEWHTVVIFIEGLIDTAMRYLRKGSKVYVEGQLRTRKWQDQQGADRYSTEVVLQGFNASLVLLDRAESDPGRSDYSGHQDNGRWNSGSFAGGSGQPGGAAQSGQRASGGFDGDLDDDVPF